MEIKADADGVRVAPPGGGVPGGAAILAAAGPGPAYRRHGRGVVVVGGADERAQRGLAGLLRAVRFLDRAGARYLRDPAVRTARGGAGPARRRAETAPDARISVGG